MCKHRFRVQLLQNPPLCNSTTIWHRIRSFCIIHSNGDFFIFMYCIQHCFIRRPSDSTVSEDAGIVPCRTVATLALTVRRSKHSARSHPQVLSQISSATSRLDLIRKYSARSHPLLGQISSTTRLDLIHYSAGSHPQVLGQISSTTRLDLIRNYSARSYPQVLSQIPSATTRLDLIRNYSARSHPQVLGQISSASTRLDLIRKYSARSHPLLGQISSTTRLPLIHDNI